MELELTKAEFQVGAYTASGFEPKETANLLFRSYHTIITHKRAAMLKYNARNIAEFTMLFVLKFGDPRKLITIGFLVMHIGFIYSDFKMRRKRVRSSNMKQLKSKHSKTREYYI